MSTRAIEPTVQALTEYEQSPPDTSWMKDGTAPDINGIADWAVDPFLEVAPTNIKKIHFPYIARVQL